MQLIKKQERIGEIAFYIGIVIHLLLMTIGYGAWNVPFHGRFMQLAFVLFCIKIVTTHYLKREWITMIALGCLGIVSYIATGDEYVVSVIVMIFASKGIDMYRICKWILIVAFVVAFGTAVLSLCGIGDMPVDIRDFGRGGEETRWSLGFGHANNLHGTVWYLITLLVIIYNKQLKCWHYLLLTIGNLGLFFFTVSRGGMIAAQVVLIAMLVLKYVPKIAEMSFIYVLALLEIVGVTVLSIVSGIISPEFTPVLSTLDSMLTGRLHLIRWYADVSQWKLLSSGGTTTLVDDGWATIFYSYGYIVGSVFVLFHLYLVYRLWKEKDGVLLTVLVTSVFYIFMESSYTMNSAYLLCNLSYITAMLLIAQKEGYHNGGKEIERNSHSNLSL